MPPTAFVSDAERPLRRRADSNSNLSPTEERRHLVRVIASNPTYLRWLSEHNARLLADEAKRAAKDGRHDLAATLRTLATAHATGQVDPW